MKTINCIKYGSPEVMKVVEREMPVPKEKEVLIKIYNSSISNVDCAFRKGEPFVARLFTGLSKPKHEVPGDIISGEIIEVGADVFKFSVGDKIYGHVGLSFGAHAEFICINEEEAIVKMADEMSFKEASAIAYSAMTALPFMRDYTDIKEGSQVLINGASGAIGTFAVQLAKKQGAVVTGVCGPSNVEMVKLIGSDHVIDYSKQDFNTNQSSYDVIFDAVGKSSYKSSKPALKAGGVYLTTVPSFGVLTALITNIYSSKKSKFVATGLRKSPQKIKDLLYLNDLFIKGDIKPVIDQVFTIDEIISAHSYVEKGHNKGNVLLSFHGEK